MGTSGIEENQPLIPVRVGTDSLVTWRDAEPSGAVAA
jgi:hypothetical protein